jgi:hypothetical protein
VSFAAFIVFEQAVYYTPNSAFSLTNSSPKAVVAFANSVIP